MATSNWTGEKPSLLDKFDVVVGFGWSCPLSSKLNYIYNTSFSITVFVNH